MWHDGMKQLRQVVWRDHQHHARLCISVWHHSLQHSEFESKRKAMESVLEDLQLELGATFLMAKESAATHIKLKGLLMNEQSANRSLLSHLDKSLHEEATLANAQRQLISSQKRAAAQSFMRCAARETKIQMSSALWIMYQSCAMQKWNLLNAIQED